MATFESMLASNPGTYDDLLKALASTAAAGTDASPMVKEDLEVEAHSQLWLETSPNELVILKHLPRVPAYSVTHEFRQIYGYGGASHDGFYGEDSLPGDSNLESRPKTTAIKLMGTTASVFALASFQNTIQALGQSTLVDEQMAAARLNLLHKMAVASYSSDTRPTTHTLRFAGLKQLILEGTSVSTTPPFTVNTDYIIDLRGAKLTPVEVRARAAQTSERHGCFNWLFMSPQASAFFEASLDAAERVAIPRAPGEKVILGQNVGGMNTAGGEVLFAVDNTLTPRLHFGSAPAVAATGAPAPLPGGNIGTPTVAPNGASLWIAADANAAVVYSFTALNAAGESTATALAPISVATGDGVTIAITPRAADTSYRVYRGSSTMPTPQFIRELVGTGNTTPFNFVDLNQRIPGTSEVYGLSVLSQNNQAIRMNDMSRVALANAPLPRNTVTLQSLGPWMGVFELAHVLHTASRDLLFSAFAPQITHPFQNVVWINVGDR